MSVIELDFHEPDDTLIGTLTDDQLIECELRPALQELGAISFTVSRHLAEASTALLAKGNLVKVRIPVVDAEPIVLFVLKDDISELLSRDEQGGEHLTLTGPGGLHMLSYARLREEVYAPEQPTRGDWDDDVSWNWRGRAYGAILARVMEEGQHQPGNPLGAITIDFDREEDSDGVPWAIIAEDFTVPIGIDVLTVVNRLATAGDLYLVLTPDLVLHAYQTYGRDLTGAFAADNVRFEKGVNILTELQRKTQMSRVTHLITRDFDQVYRTFVTPDAFDQAVYGFLEVASTNDPDQVEKIALAALSASDEGQESYLFEALPGDDPEGGEYLPGPEGTDGHLWPGDAVTIHTGTGEHDLNAQSVVLSAVSIVLDVAADDSTDERAARSLRIVPEVAFGTLLPTFSERDNPSGSGAPGCVCLKLCQPNTQLAASCSLSVDVMTQIPTPNGDFEMGDGTNWTGAVVVGGDPAGVGGSFCTSATIVGPGGWFYQWTGSFPVGVTVVARYFVVAGSTFISFGDVGSADFVDGQPATEGWNCIEWTPSATRTVMQFHHFRLGSGSIGGDNLQAYTGGAGPGDGPVELVGSSVRASRCDHNHLIENLLTEEIDTGLVLVPDGSGGVTFGTVESGPVLSDDVPEAEAGAGDPGESEEASRSDHVHPADEDSGGGGGGSTTAVVLGLPTGTLDRDYTFDSTVESWTNDLGTLSSTGSKLRLVHTSGAIAVEPSGASDVADGEATWDFNTVAMTGSVGLIFRYVDANNFYMVTFQPAFAMQMFKRVAGTFSSFGTAAAAPSFARAVIPIIRVMVRFVGSRIEVYVNGTLVLWEVDTAHTTGRVGIRADNATMEVDNVKVYSGTDYLTSNL